MQLENGVGMLRLLIEETDYTLEALSGDERAHTLSLATGKLAYPFLRDIAAKVHEKFPNVNITVYEILNDFFGHGVTVSGLITGQDLIKQLKGKPLGEVLLLPANMFRSNEEVFLDDLTKQDVEKALQVPINIVKSDGQELIRAMLMEESEEQARQAAVQYREIVNLAKEDALKTKATIQEQANQEYKAKLDQARREIEAEKAQAKAAMKQEIVEVAIDVATKVMNKEMDTKTNKALVEDFVEEVVN